MGHFCGITSPERWTNHKKPKEPPGAPDYSKLFVNFLNDLMGQPSLARESHDIVEGTPLREIAKGGEPWNRFLQEASKRFCSVVDEWRRDVSELAAAWRDIPQQPAPQSLVGDKTRANALRYQIKARCDITVIECLADGRFLPRYGFPINLQRLSVRVPREEGGIGPRATRDTDWSGRHSLP
jgi:hypothetical protein